MSQSEAELARTELATLRAELDALKAERALLTRSLEYHERDRQLLAFEIHDGLVQDMTAALMFLESAAQGLSGATAAEKDSLDRGIRLLSGSVTEARRLIQGLIPVILDERGLVPSLEKMMQRFHDDHGLEIQLLAKIRFIHLTPAVEMVVLRIVQEALNNVWRHSGSTQASVTLVQRESELEVSIEDRGIGFDPSQVQKTRYGLAGMRERARLFGGSATIASAPGQGTRILLTLPLADALLPAEFRG